MILEKGKVRALKRANADMPRRPMIGSKNISKHNNSDDYIRTCTKYSSRKVF